MGLLVLKIGEKWLFGAKLGLGVFISAICGIGIRVEV